jgi:hypothetical protein
MALVQAYTSASLAFESSRPDLTPLRRSSRPAVAHGDASYSVANGSYSIGGLQVSFPAHTICITLVRTFA